jgi:hypothetical protein
MLQLAQPRPAVFAPGPGPVVGVHARDQPAERRDAVALADAQHGRVDVGRARFQRAECVGNRAAGVVVAVELDVAVGQPAQRADQPPDLRGRGDADRVGDAEPVDDAEPVHGEVDAQQLRFIAAERVLGAEAQLDIGRLRANPRQHSAAVSMISSMLLPWLNWRRREDVPITTSTPSTPASSATCASSRWQRMWVRMRRAGPARDGAQSARLPARPAARSVPGTRRRTRPARRDAIFCSVVNCAH